MSIYNYFIIYELSNNKTFVKIEIKNNKIECDNKVIKKDIEEKRLIFMYRYMIIN